jgi:hypothetical protein
VHELHRYRSFAHRRRIYLPDYLAFLATAPACLAPTASIHHCGWKGNFYEMRASDPAILLGATIIGGMVTFVATMFPRYHRAALIRLGRCAPIEKTKLVSFDPLRRKSEPIRGDIRQKRERWLPSGELAKS